MRLSDYDYTLPSELIAQEALEPRDEARLLNYSLGSGQCLHQQVRDLPESLQPGDLLVVNDTRVRPARLFTRRESGGRVELLFLGLKDSVGVGGEADPKAGAWEVLVRPARKLKPGECLSLPDHGHQVRAIQRCVDGQGTPAATWTMEVVDAGGNLLCPESVEALLAEAGQMPLPPYIQRAPEGDGRAGVDRERYQTVFAQELGAVAAPTAGLHLTEDLLARLEGRGVDVAQVTLHVGLGTFQPVTAEDPREHPMHAEWFRVGEETVAKVQACRERGGRVVAVGTTSVRALESAAQGGKLVASQGSTQLFLYPGCSLRCVDGLLTNFHLPRSTLLMLVSTLTGRETLLVLYHEAIERGYRFYSYGDAMLILP